MASKTQHRTKKPSSVKKRPLASWPQGKALFAALIIASLAVFVLPLTESVALWGFTFPAFVIGPEFYIIIAVAVAAAAWAFKPGKDEVPDATQKPVFHWVLALAVIGGMSWAINAHPVAFAFLGDGTLYIGEVFRIVSLPDYQSTLMKATTWLGGWTVTWVAQSFALDQANEAFQITGLISFATLALGLFLLLRKERLQIVLLWTVLLLGTGGMLLFFGYIELYAPGYALAGLYLISSWAVFRSQLHPALSAIILILAIAATASNAIFIPSLLLLLHWKYKGTKGKPSMNQTAGILIGLPVFAIIILYIVFGMGKGNPYLIPVTAFQQIENGVNFGTQSYTLFSGIHMLDVINVLYITSGLSVFLLLFAAFAWKSVRWTGPRVLFGIVAATGTLLLCITGNTTFGMARDWDIMAATGPAAAFLVIAILTQLWEKKQLPLLRFIPLIAVLALAPTYYWVKVNAEAQPSAERFTQLVDRYEPYVTPGYTYNALENLRKFYFAEGMTEGYINTLLRMGETRYDMLGNYRELIGALKKPEAQPVAKQAFSALLTDVAKAAEEPLPNNDYRYLPESVLRQFTVQALLGAKESGYESLAESYVPRFQEAFDSWPEFAMYQAYQYPREEPQLRYEAIKKLDLSSLTDIALIIRAANLSKNARQFQEAVSLYEHALKIDPNQYQNIYLTLAEIYYRVMMDKEKTIEVLRRCITNCVGTKASEKAQSILSQLQTEG